MSEDKTGGPAFPLPYECYTDKAIPGNTELFGMTLRDYFAAKIIVETIKHCKTNESAAREAYKVADAMIKWR